MGQDDIDSIIIIQILYKIQMQKISRKEQQDEDDEEVDEDQQQQEQQDDNEYEQDDFVVDDNQDSQSEQSRKGRKKSRKLKRKHEQQWDEQDINLIQQVEKANRNNRKRLKKNRQQNDDEELFNQNQYDKDLKQEQDQQIQNVQDQPDQMSQINDYVQVKNRIEDIFQPGGLDQYYIKKQDQLIVQADIPQRLQLKFKNRTEQQDLKQQLIQQAKWIFQKMKQRFDQRKHGVIKQKIFRVLDLIRNQKCQIMYIYYYKRLVYAEQLNLEYLWKIYQLDSEWAIVKQMKKQLAQQTIPFLTSSGIQINHSIMNLLEQANDLKTLKILKQYTQFELSKRKIKKDKRKLPAKSNLVAQVFQHGIVRWIENSKIWLSPAKLYENIREKVQKHKPHTPQVSTKNEVQRFVDKRKNLFTESSIITTMCRYLQLQLFTYPDLRRWIKQKYYKRIVISTTPTKKGQQDINLYSSYFPVKRIVKKPITSFRADTYLLIREAQKLDLIKTEMMFEWQLTSTSRNNQSDPVYKDLTQFYLDHSHHSKSDIADVWNIFRRQVILKLINNNIVPSLHRQIKKDLYQQAEKQVILNCCQKFRYQLNKGPSLKPDQKPPIILALVLQHQKLGIAIVDPDGNLQFKGVIKISFESSIQYVVRGKVLNQHIQQYKPDLIVISANCRQSITLRKELRAAKLQMRSARQQFCALGDYQICSLVAKRQIMKGSNQQLVILQAISLARLKLNGMAEILNMWSQKIEDNGVLYMNLHPSQKLVNQHKLKSQLERVAVQMVNLVGINLNQLKQCSHLQKQLQFVCGLGPRKALNFLQKLKGLEQKQIKRRRQLLLQNIIGKTVYKNCSGFFKIITKAHLDFLQNSKIDKKSLQKQQISLLELTRIHDQNYSLVLKMAITAVADGPKKKNIDQQNAVAQLFKNPSKIKNIQFDKSANIDHQFISKQFASRFQDPREPQRPIQNRQAFFSILRQTPQTLKKYMIFSVKIIGVAPHHLTVKITQNGLLGWIKLQNENKIQYKKDSIIKSLILRFPFDPIDDKKKHNDKGHQNHEDQQLLKVQMALKFPCVTSKQHNCLTQCFQNIVKQIHPRIDLQHFNLKKQDMPILEMKQQVRGRTQLRLINHPKFKNVGITQAIQWLNSEPIGQFIIRPSMTKGKDYLTITWKFFEGVITHIGVKIQSRIVGTMSFIYKIQERDRQRTYNSFDQIIQNYIKPMNRIMQDVVSNRKFLPIKIDQIQNKLKIDRQKQPNIIHYYFGCTPQYPQFIVLTYTKDIKVIRQYIKVKDCGLVFHQQVFPSLKDLITWFKTSFKDKDYQKYIPKASQTIRR